VTKKKGGTEEAFFCVVVISVERGLFVPERMRSLMNGWWVIFLLVSRSATLGTNRRDSIKRGYWKFI